MKFRIAIFLCTLLCTAVIYYLTLAPDVVQIDAGELAAIQYTLGIAHPTGYPLFTLLGWLFTRILIFDTVIQQVNFLALLYGTIALGLFWETARLMLLKLLSDKSAIITELLASALTLSLAFNKTFWSQNTATEVYSLHLVWLCLSLYLLTRICFDTTSGSNRLWYGLAISLGLGFSNHLTTLMILPGISWLFFSKKKLTSPATWKLFGKMLLIFFGILAVFYGGLMLRASQNPDLNWGNPDEWNRFITHVSGWQYRVWLFSSTKVTKTNLATFFSGFIHEYAPIVPLIMLAGLIMLWKKIRTWAVFLLICFFFTVFYASNYDIHDLDSYFLLAYISASLLLGFGWAGFIHKIRSSYTPLIIAIAFIPPLWQAVSYYTVEDRSKVYVFGDYTRAAFSSVPEEAIIFSYQWDYLISPSYYYQFVEQHRKDVCMIDKELLRRSWYYAQLSGFYPEVMKVVEEDSKTFIEEVRPMEQGRQNFNASILEQLYRKIITDLMYKTGKPVYVAIELMQNEIRQGSVELPKGYNLIPDKYFLKLIPDTSGYQYLEFSPYEIRFSERPDKYELEISKILASMAAYRAMYEKAAGYPERAIQWRNEALRIKPDYQMPDALKMLSQS